MKLFVAKIVVAVVAIGGIALVAAAQIAPAVAPWKVLLAVAAFVAALVSLALLHAFVTGSLKQLLLRWGAIDTQWLWAPDYPEGFKQQWRGGEDKR
ncbi:hypothetical protein ACG04R_15300 [Roseateles sp. BYS78W]|uniref:Uncharacterized protein n=1 Tax=Pelomonas candidula TaxID=3299025 RepID=A0ABW7HE03_9BURK